MNLKINLSSICFFESLENHLYVIYFSKSGNSIKIISIELESLNYSLKKDVRITDEIKSLYEDLKKINIKLWSIEDGKRDCERNGDFGEKFIQLARSVYIENDQRAKIKNKINKISGSNISEVKSYDQY